MAQKKKGWKKGQLCNKYGYIFVTLTKLLIIPNPKVLEGLANIHNNILKTDFMDDFGFDFDFPSTLIRSNKLKT